MPRPVRYVAAGLLAFLAFMVILLPAPVMMRWMPPQVSLSGLEGTLWKGRAQQLHLQGHTLGALQWDCNLLRILLLQWACEVSLQPAGGGVLMQVTRYPNGVLQLQDITGSVPVTTFEGLASPPGWSGQAEFDVGSIRIENDWPDIRDGQLRVRHLKAPGPGGAMIGDFELQIGEGTVGSDKLSGRLSDLGGPLRVRATLEVSRSRNYLISGEVAPGPGANEAIFRTLAFLGPPDSIGRRPFAIEGDF